MPPMRSLWLIPSVLWQVPAAQAQSQQNATIVARAIEQAPNAVTVAYIAQNAEPTVYDQQRRPELAGKSLREIAAIHCGSDQPGYLDALRSLNPQLPSLPAPGPVGAQAYQIKWPACLRVDNNLTAEYQIQPADTLTSIKQKFTGSGVYSPSALNRFFSLSGLKVSDSHRLVPGRTIKIPLGTSETILVPTTVNAIAFAAQVQALAGDRVVATANVEGSGSIIGPVEFRQPEDHIGATQGTFDPCPGDDPNGTYPFKASEVSAAYLFTRQQLDTSVAPVTAVVVDNGFFGVPCDPMRCPVMAGDRVADVSRFPRKLFDTLQFDPRSGFGPVLSGTKINPLNYWNRKPDGRYFGSADVDAVSGHGTHVAGLVIGGPRFETFRAAFDGEANKSWLKLVIANLANGRDVLLPGMDRDLADMLGAIEGRRIVNMSVAFNARPGSIIGNTIRDAILQDSGSLFVVAAGNDGGNLEGDNLDLYPANLGGVDNNVITVASADGLADGRLALSSFTNRSARYVDIAAPGCRILSWLDGQQPAAEVSGTSQATPIVSFAAAMLSSLWQASPQRIKSRLLYSGDLLPLPTDRLAVRSQSTLNIAKALTFTFDRIEFERDSARRVLLGRLKPIDGLKCQDGSVIAATNLRAAKRQADRGMVFFRTRNAGGLSICPGQFEGGEAIDFVPLYEVKAGTIAPAPLLEKPLSPSEIVEIVQAK